MEDVIVCYQKETDMLELYFERPPKYEVLAQLKKGNDRFYWNKEKGCWYGARNEKREAFLDSILQTYYQIRKEYESVNGNSEPLSHAFLETINRIADHYDTVGLDMIYPTSDVLLKEFMHTGPMSGGAYIKDEALYICLNKNDYVRIIELENAQKKDNQCVVYDLYFADAEKSGVYTYLTDICKIQTAKDLYQAIKEPARLGALSLDKNILPSKRVFSPFCTVEPLSKLPLKWTKETLDRALLSGQIYDGVVAYEITDEPDKNLVHGAMKGKVLELPELCKDMILAYDGQLRIKQDVLNEREARLTVKDLNSEKILFVDLDCDIRTGLVRKTKKEELKAFQKKEQLKNILPLWEQSILPQAFYRIEFLKENPVTKGLDIKKALVQGSILLDKNHPDHEYGQLIRIEEANLCLDKLYQVSSFLRPVKLPFDNERLLFVGNKDVLISGHGLMELSKEMDFPYINERPFCGDTFSDAKTALAAFIEGEEYWGVKNANIDYKGLLIRIEKEEMRCKESITHRSGIDVIKDADIFKEPVKKDLDSLLLQIKKKETERKSKKQLIRKDHEPER